MDRTLYLLIDILALFMVAYLIIVVAVTII